MKSFGCHPAAKDRPTRPSDRLSTTAHSSATRMGWWSGDTQLPDRIRSFLVIAANAAPVTDGFGNGPPNAWKWRSGVQTESNPFSSKKRRRKKKAEEDAKGAADKKQKKEQKERENPKNAMEAIERLRQLGGCW